MRPIGVKGLLWAAALVYLAGASGCGRDKGAEAPVPVMKSFPARIVSLAPSVTETLYAIGAGNRVAGVTKFCVYPPEARNKPNVGGFLDPNYEAIVALKPDLVVLLPSHGQSKKYLEGLDLRVLTVKNEPVEEIFRTIATLGETCGVSEAADSLVASLRARMRAVGDRTRNLPKTRVLVSAGRTVGTGAPGAVFAAGPGTYYDELIALAGGENAYRGKTIPYPELSAEAIIRLDPEVIVDLVPELESRGLTAEKVRADWSALPEVRAVKNGRVHVLSGSYTTVPGPRFILLLEELARILHPEAS